MYCSVKKIQRGRRGHSKQNVLNYNKKNIGHPFKINVLVFVI
jgi:hypothetical protein